MCFCSWRTECFFNVALTLDTSRNSSHVKQLQMPWWTLYMIFGWSVILRVGSQIEAVGILYPQQTKTTWRVNKHTNSLLGSKNNPAGKVTHGLDSSLANQQIESASTDPRHDTSHQTCAWYIHVKIPWVLPKNWFYWQLLVPLLQGIFACINWCQSNIIKWQLLWQVLNKSERKKESLFRLAFHLVSQLLTTKDSCLQPSLFPTKSNHFNAIWRCPHVLIDVSDITEYGSVQNKSSQGQKREMYGHVALNTTHLKWAYCWWFKNSASHHGRIKTCARHGITGEPSSVNWCSVSSISGKVPNSSSQSDC